MALLIRTINTALLISLYKHDAINMTSQLYATIC